MIQFPCPHCGAPVAVGFSLPVDPAPSGATAADWDALAPAAGAATAAQLAKRRAQIARGLAAQPWNAAEAANWLIGACGTGDPALVPATAADAVVRELSAITRRRQAQEGGDR